LGILKMHSMKMT